MSGLSDPLQYKSYFGQHLGTEYQNNEIQMYDNATAEYFGIYGIPTEYYPVDVDTSNVVFGEDQARSYLKKINITTILDQEGFDENLLYSGFGQLVDIDFRLYIHIPTFMKQVAREPLPGDQFYLPYNSSFVYEVSNANHVPLGRAGNIFGFKSCFVINARQRAVTSVSAGYAERFGVTDAAGNIRSDAPADALVTDGSGRIKDKYSVPGPKISSDVLKDNAGIQDIVDGKQDSQGNRDGGVSTPISPEVTKRWGDW
jgi:hypothetical protein